VPTLPWSGSQVAISFEDCGGVIPADAYDRACIHSLDEALACCAAIGYPIMLKASWGGGGKGIRKVPGSSLHKAAGCSSKLAWHVQGEGSTAVHWHGHGALTG